MSAFHVNALTAATATRCACRIGALVGNDPAGGSYKDVREYPNQAEELGYKVLVRHDGANALGLVIGAHIGVCYSLHRPAGRDEGRQLSQGVTESAPGLAVLYTTGYTPNAIIHHGRARSGCAAPFKAVFARRLARNSAVLEY